MLLILLAGITFSGVRPLVTFMCNKVSTFFDMNVNLSSSDCLDNRCDCLCFQLPVEDCADPCCHRGRGTVHSLAL
jgi:hypothetical protein